MAAATAVIFESIICIPGGFLLSFVCLPLSHELLARELVASSSPTTSTPICICFATIISRASAYLSPRLRTGKRDTLADVFVSAARSLAFSLLTPRLAALFRPQSSRLEKTIALISYQFSLCSRIILSLDWFSRPRSIFSPAELAERIDCVHRSAGKN